MSVSAVAVGLSATYRQSASAPLGGEGRGVSPNSKVEQVELGGTKMPLPIEDMARITEDVGEGGANLFKEILDIISASLPYKKIESVEQLAFKLIIEQGARSTVDLKHIEKEYLKTVLTPVDCSKLHSKFMLILALTSDATDSATQELPVQNSEQHSGNSIDSRRLEQSVAVTLFTGLPIFTASSPALAIVQAELVAKKRPANKDRKTMVATITKTCLETVPDYDYCHTRVIADQIVKSYEASFKDTIPDPKNSLGSASLRKQLRVCLENIRRTEAKKAGALAGAAKATNPEIPQAHGCTNWGPELPVATNLEELKGKQNQMKVDFFTIPEAQWDFAVVGPILIDTYPLQRADLNLGISCKPIRKGKKPENLPDPLSAGQVKERWPFLLTLQGMGIHFQMLTNKEPFFGIFTGWLDKNCEDTVKMLMIQNETTTKLHSLMENAIRAESCELPEVAAMLIFIVIYFKEDMTFLVLRAEDTIDAEEISQLNLPPTPVIVSKGKKLFKCKKFFLVADKEVVATVSNLKSAFAMIFQLYFILNVKYPDELAATLMFIQKEIAQIIPTKGSRCKPSANATVTRKVTKLANKLATYKSSKPDGGSDEEY